MQKFYLKKFKVLKIGGGVGESNINKTNVFDYQPFYTENKITWEIFLKIEINFKGPK